MSARFELPNAFARFSRSTAESGARLTEKFCRFLVTACLLSRLLALGSLLELLRTVKRQVPAVRVCQELHA